MKYYQAVFNRDRLVALYLKGGYTSTFAFALDIEKKTGRVLSPSTIHGHLYQDHEPRIAAVIAYAGTFEIPVADLFTTQGVTNERNEKRKGASA